MQFRYKLNKDAFKGKKIPPPLSPGSSEEHISPDQRGNHTKSIAAPRPDLLALDAETISQAKQAEIRKKEEALQKEVSRRDLFFLDRLKEYSDESDKKEKEGRKGKKRAAQGTGDDQGSPDAGENADAGVESIIPEAPQEQQPGFFKRLWARIRPGSTEETAPESVVSENATPDADPSPSNAAAPSFAVQAAEAVRQELRSARAEFRTGTSGEEMERESEDDFDPAKDDPEYSRRGLLREGFHFFAKPAVNAVQTKIDKVNSTIDKLTKRPALIRPPGAIWEGKFLQACTRCDKCMHACPKDAIKRAPRKMGLFIAGTPYIEPLKVPCVMCDGLPCIEACDDGALVMPPSRSKFDVKMGYAILDKSKCAAYGGLFCQQCVIDCPIPGAITQTQEGLPEIHKNICTGCGVCARSCNTVNTPVAIKIKPQMVVEAQLRRKEKEQAYEEARVQFESPENFPEPSLESETEESPCEDPHSQS
ncbi:MAG: hypothetical protein COV67_05620 [Nitrospinae bacterium CG11_big_fil_rev_8_21_14_0_20_56_8]|nr:MAG: hypothetical protein COV67_05620 [Nitrospinae bacterium CG11_big_fil_rev_8_21_14_0_20_56_8]